MLNLPSSPDHTLGTPKPRSVGSKLRDHLGNQVAKRERVVLVGLGGIALPFEFFSFHSAASIQTGGENNAR